MTEQVAALRKENFYQKVEIIRLKAQLAMTQNELLGLQLKMMEAKLNEEEQELLRELGE